MKYFEFSQKCMSSLQENTWAPNLSLKIVTRFKGLINLKLLYIWEIHKYIKIFIIHSLLIEVFKIATKIPALEYMSVKERLKKLACI